MVAALSGFLSYYQKEHMNAIMLCITSAKLPLNNLATTQHYNDNNKSVMQAGWAQIMGCSQLRVKTAGILYKFYIFKKKLR